MKTRIHMTARLVTVLSLGVVLLLPGSARAQDDSGWDWPQEIQSGKAIITMYQPQLDSTPMRTVRVLGALLRWDGKASDEIAARVQAARRAIRPRAMRPGGTGHRQVSS